jgi:uncharacterized protein (TIGR02246 family)
MAAGKQRTAATPAAAIELFAQCMNAGDIEGAMSLYEPEALFAPEPGRGISGHAAIREALEGFAALRPRMDGTIAQVLEAGDTALVTNHWTLEGTGADGKPVRMSGTSSDVLRRQPNGRWLVLVDDPWSAGAGAA